MANTPNVREIQAQSSQSTVADLASNRSTVNPWSTSQTSEAPSKGLTARADDQNPSPKSYENCHLSDADSAQDLAGIGSWADSTTECLESVREVEDILNGELELSLRVCEMLPRCVCIRVCVYIFIRQSLSSFSFCLLSLPFDSFVSVPKIWEMLGCRITTKLKPRLVR